MAAGVELPDFSAVAGVAGVAFELPVFRPSPPGKLPRRVRERLMETRSPTSAEEIEARLRGAGLRRQQFHDWLSSKARRKPRSPSWSSSSQDEDLGQRLEAKLYAAEQKRLEIMEKAQMRLARLNELRKAAKAVVEMRYESERKELGTKVESRVRQAELNRMLLLKANRIKRALRRERTAKSLSQRRAREFRFKERMYSSLCQKSAAAERKRSVLLEAEKMRAGARVMRAQRVAKSVYHLREVERSKMKDQLDDKLQRAKRHRAEYLKQRGSPCGMSRVNFNKKNGDFLSRKLARCWRQFSKTRKTTFALAKSYDALAINERFIKLVPFEQLASRLESVTTIQTVRALLDRLESRSTLLQSNVSTLRNIDHLLKRITSPPRRRVGSANTKKSNGTKNSSGKEMRAPLRYQARVVLCAYMILSHPDAVFSGLGEREVALSEAAQNFTKEFELLLKIILEGPSSRQSAPDSDAKNFALPAKRQTFRSQLAVFDASWCSYLYSFVAWKVKDARSLEEDLVRVACQLELSMMQKCKITENGDSSALSHDLKAIQTQVLEDQELLREKVEHLSGNAGIERMKSAILNTRFKFFESHKSGSVEMTPPAHILSSTPFSANQPSSDKKEFILDGERSKTVVRSLFKDSPDNKMRSTSSGREEVYDHASADTSERISNENVHLVNGIVHDGHLALPDDLSGANGEQNLLKAKIKQTMERAYWDGVAESVGQGTEPDFGRIIQLVEEIRDELCALAPESWKQEIVDAIDVDILSQLLKTGTFDPAYFGGILEYSLIKLEHLSAPAKVPEMEKTHKNLLKELLDTAESHTNRESSFLSAVIKGLRFTLEQIQTLKLEVSIARMEIFGSMIKGGAGIEYLRKAFMDCHGMPLNAKSSLPVTMKWIASLKDTAEQEWREHNNLSSTTVYHNLPSAGSLKSGASILRNGVKDIIPVMEYRGSSGDKIDVRVRVGLLKLACGIEGLTEETVPETLRLNFLRLRNVQSQFQMTMVTATSMLILRQILLMERTSAPDPKPTDVEKVVADSVAGLFELFDSSPDVGIVEITDKICTLASLDSGDKLQARKDMMSTMLLKSLRAEDAIFSKVSQAIYSAARALMLGGCTEHGRELADKALRRVGANVLTERVVMSAKVLIRLAVVTVEVHGQWYAALVDNASSK